MGLEPISSQLPRRKPSHSISQSSIPAAVQSSTTPHEPRISQHQSRLPGKHSFLTVSPFKQRLESHHSLANPSSSTGPPSIPLPVLPPPTFISEAISSVFKTQSNERIPLDSAITNSKSLQKLNNIPSRTTSSTALKRVLSSQKPTLKIRPHSNFLRVKNNSTYSPVVTNSNSSKFPQNSPATTTPVNPTSQTNPVQTNHHTTLPVVSNDRQPPNQESFRPPSQYVPYLLENAIEALASPGVNWKSGPHATMEHPLSLLSETSPSSLRSNNHHALNRNSTVSTWTLASNRSSSQEDLSSNLASIQLPSRPIHQVLEQTPQDSTTSPVLISNFPLPPSHNSFLRHDATSPLVSSFEIPLLSPTRMQSPSLPPQIPLPPIPSSSKSPHDVTGMMNPINPTSLETTHRRFSGLLESIQLFSVLDAPDLNVGILDLYLDPNSTYTKVPTRALPDLKPEDPANSFDSVYGPPFDHTITRSNSCNSITHHYLVEDQISDMVNDPQLDIHSHELSTIDSDGEENSSEIDLNEPLEVMAVRLGYQNETDISSDSDGESDFTRSRQLDDDNDLLQNFPYDHRLVLSRQTQYSQSSIRSNLPLPLKKFEQLEIAEASSSDEEQFDLTLDHQLKSQRRKNVDDDPGSQRRWYSRRGSDESVETTVSFSTTPSSSRLSDQTHASTPNSTQPLKMETSFSPNKGTIGLGFVMETLGNTNNPKRTSHLDTSLTGFNHQRRESLQREVDRRELSTYQPPPEELSPSRAIYIKPNQEIFTGLQPSSSRESKVDSELMVETIRKKAIRSSILREEESEEGDRVEMILSSSPNKPRNVTSSTGLKLKPLMLVNRKSIGRLSHTSSSLNLMDDESRRNSVSSRLSMDPLSPASDFFPSNARNRLCDLVNLVKPRPSLVNISYRSSISSIIPRAPPIN